MFLSSYSGNPEIGEVEMATLVKQHVARLEVAMNDLLFMGVAHGITKYAHDANNLRKR